VATPAGRVGLAAFANNFAGPSAANFRPLLLLVRSFLGHIDVNSGIKDQWCCAINGTQSGHIQWPAMDGLYIRQL